MTDESDDEGSPEVVVILLGLIAVGLLGGLDAATGFFLGGILTEYMIEAKTDD